MWRWRSVHALFSQIQRGRCREKAAGQAAGSARDHPLHPPGSSGARQEGPCISTVCTAHLLRPQTSTQDSSKGRGRGTSQGKGLVPASLCSLLKMDLSGVGWGLCAASFLHHPGTYGCSFTRAGTCGSPSVPHPHVSRSSLPALLVPFCSVHCHPHPRLPLP